MVSAVLDDRSETIFLGLHNVDARVGRKNVVLVDDLRSLLTEARDAGWSFSPEAEGKRMVLTFDDGRLMYPECREVLDEFAVTGLFFVCTDAVINSYPADGPDGAPLDDDDVAYLRERHWVGSHTRDHRDLATLGGAEARAYLEDSFAEFERVFGYAPTLFSYPWGRYNRSTLAALASLGVSHAFLAHGGRERPLGHRYLIPRVFLDVMPRSEPSYARVLADHRRLTNQAKVQVRNLMALGA